MPGKSIFCTKILDYGSHSNVLPLYIDVTFPLETSYVAPSGLASSGLLILLVSFALNDLIIILNRLIFSEYHFIIYILCYLYLGTQEPSGLNTTVPVNAISLASPGSLKVKVVSLR